MMASLPSAIIAQANTGMWKRISAEKAQQSDQLIRKAIPVKETFFSLNIEALKTALVNVGNRFESESYATVSFPDANGKLNRFKVFEASIMEPALQAQFPEIRSYVAQGIENPHELMRFSITPQGLHTMTFGTDMGTQFIDPYSKNDNIYTVYAKKDIQARNFGFECDVIGDDVAIEHTEDLNVQARNADDGNLRNYRIAIGCTGEYANFHIAQAGVGAGTDAQKRAAVLAAMNVTMTRVNGVYERDLSVTMTIIANNTLLIFLDPGSDPYTNNNGGALLGQNQTVCDALIGASNYDIGHVFTTGGGGIASLGSTCVNGLKARGVTGLPAPVGDAYDIDFVAHELGHQFGAPHTFNGNAPGTSCLTQRTASNAYEPGSGTTIMAYAGICPPQNVQSNSDPYFHQKSLQVMWDHITSFASCPGNTTATGNSDPTSNAGANHTIPRSTPYKLTGSSTDPDGTASHIFTWEQYDLGPAGLPLETNISGPLVRSFEGTTSPIRYVPRLQDVLSNGGSSTTWEKLSLVNRNITYRLTVRDNDPRGGQTAVDEMVATVNNSAGPFVVTSQNVGGITYEGNSTQEVTWNVAGTTGSGINTANVNILLSTNGGFTFDTVLLANTPNDGSQNVVLPNVSAPNCRIIVEAVGNIFYNINLQPFQIEEDLSIDESTLDNSLSIYPNPTNGEFTVEFNSGSGEDINIGVYDIRGRAIYTKTYNSVSRFEDVIRLNEVQSGVYLLNISDGPKKVTKKIVVN